MTSRKRWNYEDNMVEIMRANHLNNTFVNIIFTRAIAVVE